MSKYDIFWNNLMDIILPALKKVDRDQESVSIDVSALKNICRRKTWFGNLIINQNGIIKSSMAHVGLHDKPGAFLILDESTHDQINP